MNQSITTVISNDGSKLKRNNSLLTQTLSISIQIQYSND